MLKIACIIRVLCIAYFLSAAIQSNCYAKIITKTQEISIGCSPTPEEAQPQIYPGASNTYLKLVTKGIMVRTGERYELIKDWDWQNGDILVVARCITPEGHSVNAKSMFPDSEQHLTTFPTLDCEMGESISVLMDKPNNPNPDKYQYIADLKISRLVHGKNSLHPSEISPIK
ncbi:MAG: hypothetical protein ACD_69C00362G0002 [uncultured bacterium]|nr:MAG: hypothetical protein ACD_69C00362G0002 [uncultured bacterium]HBY55402.1 hypothetical protein [Coxiellaceae bacterium]